MRDSTRKLGHSLNSLTEYYLIQFPLTGRVLEGVKKHVQMLFFLKMKSLSVLLKNFEGFINLHCLSANVIDPISVKKAFDIPAASACWLPSKREKETKAFGEKGQYFFLLLFDFAYLASSR